MTLAIERSTAIGRFPNEQAGTVLQDTCTATVFKSLSEAEAVWRRLEAADAILTPYQRFDWLEALHEAGAEPDGRVAIVVLVDGETPIALLPLIAFRQGAFTHARLLGAPLSNSDSMIIRRDYAGHITPARIMSMFAAAQRALGGLDLVRFTNLPQSFGGIPNPLIGPDAELSANNLYCTAIAPTNGPFIETGLSAKRRSNIQRGSRRLAEQFGPVRLVEVSDEETLRRVHAEFLRQRGQRFEQMGITNIFAQDYFVRFFIQAAMRGFGKDRPALRFHALYAGEEIVATCCGAYAGTHYSQYINSTSGGPAAKYSLSGVLMALLMDQLLAEGVRSIDMGTGDFDYKTDWTAATPIFDSVIPLTAQGRIAVPIFDGLRAAKRALKQNPRLWPLVVSARKGLHRLRRSGGRI